MEVGDGPVGMAVPVEVSVPASTTETLLSMLLTMYANRPSADHAANCGFLPTGMILITLSVFVSITAALLAVKHATMSSGRVGWMAMLCGLAGVGIVRRTLLVAGSMTETTLESWLAV